MKYAYASLTSLREFGISTIQVPDALGRRLIQTYSDRVNRIVDQVFCPLAKEISLSGGNRIIKVHDSPIIKVVSLHGINLDGSRTLIDESLYTIKENTLTFEVGGFRDYPNYKLECITGNLENHKEFPIVLTSPIESTTTSFTVEDASQLEPRDVFVFGNRMFIINDVDYNTKTITIDQPGAMPTIPSGNMTMCYGAVPSLIEEVICLFVKHRNQLQSSVGGFKTSESIGTYSYSVSGKTQGATGITEIDSILFLFIRDDFDITYL